MSYRRFFFLTSASSHADRGLDAAAVSARARPKYEISRPRPLSQRREPSNVALLSLARRQWWYRRAGVSNQLCRSGVNACDWFVCAAKLRTIAPDCQGRVTDLGTRLCRFGRGAGVHFKRQFLIFTGATKQTLRPNVACIAFGEDCRITVRCAIKAGCSKNTLLS